MTTATAEPVTDLTSIEDGTSLALPRTDSSSGVELWVKQGDTLVSRRTNSTLPLWFFSGMAREGKIINGNYRPSEVGEWWEPLGTNRYHYLCLELENNDTTLCAVFYRGTFEQFERVSSIVTTLRRTTAPTWGSEQLLSAMQRVQALESRVNGIEARASSTRRALNNVTRGIEYLRMAENHLTAAQT